MRGGFRSGGRSGAIHGYRSEEHWRPGCSWPCPSDRCPSPTSLGSVIVQDVSTPDPGKSVMVYSIAGQPGTVIWLLDSADDS